MIPRHSTCVFFVALASLGGVAVAGMPSPELTDIAKARLDSISFFVLVYFASAVLFRFVWNKLVEDFPRLPKLSLGKSVAVLVVAGLFLYFILTMISGARELMTPGAWSKKGVVYELASADQQPKQWLAAARERWMQRTRKALQDYAAAHDNQLPAHPYVPGFDSELWRGIDPAGGGILYIQGHQLGLPQRVIAFESPAHGAQRWVILSDGSLVQMESNELNARVEKEALGDE